MKRHADIETVDHVIDLRKTIEIQRELLNWYQDFHNDTLEFLLGGKEYENFVEFRKARKRRPIQPKEEKGRQEEKGAAGN